MTQVTGGGKVEFRFYRPEAQYVAVAGDFNGWRGEALPMHNEKDGWWVATAVLPPGDYRFRYVVDGRWFTDFASHGVEPAPAGYNALLFVPKSSAAVAMAAAPF